MQILWNGHFHAHHQSTHSNSFQNRKTGTKRQRTSPCLISIERPLFKGAFFVAYADSSQGNIAPTILCSPMPYEWTRDPKTPNNRHLVAWPYRSLTPRGFVWFIGITATLFLLPLLGVLGSPVIWVLLGCAVLTISAMWFALDRNWRALRIREDLIVTPDTVHLRRMNAKTHIQSWDANTHWVDLRISATGGPVANYLTLSGGHRVVEIGAFLTPDERRALYAEIQDALAACRGHA